MARLLSPAPTVYLDREQPIEMFWNAVNRIVEIWPERVRVRETRVN